MPSMPSMPPPDMPYEAPGPSEGLGGSPELPEMPAWMKAMPDMPEISPQPEETTKSDEEGFAGGLPINLDREMKSGKKLRDELESSVGKWLDQELDAQKDRIDKLSKWNKQYHGIKPAKNYPYPGCNNTSINISMYHVDTNAVRIYDAVWSQKKLFIVQGKKAPFTDMAPMLEDGLDWWQRSIVDLKAKCFSPIMQSIQTGTSMVKMDYVRRKRTAYRYATPDEEVLKPEGTFKLPNGQMGVKQVLTTYDGPDVFPISREDWVISSDAASVQDAFLCGFRTYLRKPEIEVKCKQGLYFEEIAEKLVNSDEIDDTKKERAEASFKEIRSDEKGKFEIWELWLRYDVDEDGEEDDVVITYHRASKTILRAMYNPFFIGFRPFVAFRFNPTAYSFEGKGICEILEKIQEEIDTIHNQRLDRMDQINAPMYNVRGGIGIDDWKIAPGMVRVVEDDPATAVFTLQFPDVYPSTFSEESLLNSYADKLIGIGPAAMGQQVAERPVARDTMALIQEMNKKFKFGIDNVRASLAEVGMMALEMFAQYQPKYSFYKEKEKGLEEKTIDFPLDYLRDGIAVTLAASSELLNTEVRREINLTVYQLTTDYYTKLGSMAQAILNPGLPPDFKKFLIDSAKVGEKLLGRIVEDFGGWKEGDLILPLEKSIDIQAALAPPPPQTTPPLPGQQNQPPSTARGSSPGPQQGQAGVAGPRGPGRPQPPQPVRGPQPPRGNLPPLPQGAPR
jgi:hypothetical protein